MVPVSEFARFRPALAGLPLKSGKEKFSEAELIRPEFLLFSASGLDVYYVPFHDLNRTARVVLLGLTPGWTQMEEAFRAARQGLARGLDGDELFREVGRIGSFSGPMRRNLIEMLDGIGLPDSIGIASSSELFALRNDLVHFTSVISPPVFRNGENYQGYGPALLQVPELQRWVVENLAAELAAVAHAMIVPLGRVAVDVILYLQARQLIDKNRCLTGFPHPSGANGHRKGIFSKGRELWARQLEEWFRCGATG